MSEMVIRAMQFSVGDRVRSNTKYGKIRRRLRGERTGTVVGRSPRYEECLRVKWDGRKTSEILHVSLFEFDNDAALKDTKE
jgi:hypothetical protein